jgi:putative ABC transport system ATP-binding protein
MLTARSLTKRFGTAPALEGVDFGVGPGESVAVTGPSGSGKSTLLHCLAGIMRPDTGEVRLFDERIDTLSERRRSHLRRTRFAFLFQFGQLLPELPADENVALPLMLGGVPRKNALDPARAELRRLGLEGKEGRRPGELSGGEAQRVALARALVVRPAVVFADEPTGALDRTTGDQVMGVLLDTVAELDAALVVVTHDPRIAARCTRTIEIRDGRLSGTPRTGNGERPGFDGFAGERAGAGLRTGSAPSGASALAPRPSGGAVASGAGSGADGPHAAQDDGVTTPVAFAPGAAPAAKAVAGEGHAFVPGTASGRSDQGRAGSGSAAYDSGSDGGPHAHQPAAKAVGRGGDAFASGHARPGTAASAVSGPGSRPHAGGSAAAADTGGSGPDFGHEPVVEVWK